MVSIFFRKILLIEIDIGISNYYNMEIYYNITLRDVGFSI